MKKAINNIINNAIVYSQEDNKVLIHLYEKQNKLLLDVENTGVHISEEEIPNYFFHLIDMKNQGIGILVVVD